MTGKVKTHSTYKAANRNWLYSAQRSKTLSYRIVTWLLWVLVWVFVVSIVTMISAINSQHSSCHAQSNQSALVSAHQHSTAFRAEPLLPVEHILHTFDSKGVFSRHSFFNSIQDTVLITRVSRYCKNNSTSLPRVGCCQLPNRKVVSRLLDVGREIMSYLYIVMYTVYFYSILLLRICHNSTRYSVLREVRVYCP